MISLITSDQKSTFENTVFRNNKNYEGACIDIISANLYFKNVTMENNTGSSDTPGILVNSGSV